MKNSIKNLAILTIAILSIFSKPSYAQDFVGKSNYVVIIDLSDRILTTNQDRLDIASINNVYKRFSSDVRNQLIIKSSAKFSIHILPQSGSKLNAEYYNELLTIDMHMYSMKDKRKALDAFSKKLNSTLIQLYNDAKFSANKSDYNGVDIWKYFNESLRYYLPDNYKNTVVILSDGYFDFESNFNVKSSDHRYTSTKFMRNLKNSNWKIKAAKLDYGLMNINQMFNNTQIIVLGINPKNQSLDEREKLHYFWKKWLSEMNVKCKIIDRYTTTITKQQLLAIL